MDLTTARTRLEDRGYTYLTDAQADLALNAGKNAFEDEYQWPWLVTSTSGAAPLTISDLKTVLHVRDTTRDTPLLGLDDRDILDIAGDPDTTGTAEYWWLDGTTTLRTYPVDSSASLTVRYVKFSPELSAGGDTPLIPVRYHDVWLDYSEVEALKEAKNFQLASALLADVRARRLPQLLDVFGNRNLQNPGYTVTTWRGSEDG